MGENTQKVTQVKSCEKDLEHPRNKANYLTDSNNTSSKTRYTQAESNRYIEF